MKTFLKEALVLLGWIIATAIFFNLTAMGLSLINAEPSLYKVWAILTLLGSAYLYVARLYRRRNRSSELEGSRR